VGPGVRIADHDERSAEIEGALLRGGEGRAAL
jgi:hypothetical protein